MACKLDKYAGRSAVLEFQIGCGDEMPAANAWKRLGAMRTKDMNIEWETADATADDSIGSLRENIATFLSASVSGDGVCRASGAGAANLIALTKHVASPIATGGYPFAWIRLTFPDLTFIFFANVTNMSRSAPYDDLVTYSFEASATASDFGLIIEDTPDPSADPVTGVTVSPTTLDLEVGQNDTLTVTVAPSTAPQGTVWSSSDTEVATVTQAGVVAAVSEGVATIVATSTSDSTKKGECEVTVTMVGG